MFLSKRLIRTATRNHAAFRAFPLTNLSYSTSAKHLPLTQLKPEEQQLRDMIADFAKTKVAPLVREMDESKIMDQELIYQCFDLGLMGLEIGEEYGGAGMSFISSVIVIEELAKIDPSLSVMVDVQNTLVNRIFRDFGNEEQKQKYLPRLAKDTVGSFCLTEPSSGSDAFALKATATKDGDDYILNGTKAWITNAGEAGLFVVMANVDPSKGYKGITAFVVERDNPGLTVGKREDKLGIRASSTCSVILEDCRVHKSAILGELGKGYKIAIETLNEGRIGIAAQMVGLAQGAYDATLPYLKERKQFGQPIADFQGLAHEYAYAAMEIQAARLLTYEAGRRRENGLDYRMDAAMAKNYASKVAGDVSSKCVEWMGGVGFTKEFPQEKFYRDSKIGKIYEGSWLINLDTIAKDLKKRY